MIDSVTSSWRKTASRLTHMGWDELHTRVQQEVSKRLDLALYRAGARNGHVKQAGDCGCSSPPKFFFSKEEIADRARLLKEYLPGEVESLIREADEICQHRFRLLGYENLDYGADIDWHLDAVHGKRAPLKPWFKIQFLNFDEVGDHKITWELNRHQHLVILAKAWRLTGQEKYVVELVKQWYAWQVANPYPIGINWGSSLEVAFRSLSWIWMRTLIAASPAVPEMFEGDLLNALALNGRYIEKYLSTYFSPNTHLLGEALALFFIGTLCPEIESAERWRTEGWRIVVQEADRQVRADGVYFEQSLYYHVYALDFFLHARLLAARNGMEIPASFDRVLGRMLDVLRAVSQTGAPDSFGDDDGGRLFNPRRNRAEHLTDPLAIGAVMFQRGELKPAANLTEESIWLFGERAVAFLKQDDQSSRSKIESVSFPAGGIYVMASSGESEQQMVIDAGPQGIGHSGHGHADALSVRVSLNGRRWLVDPGAFGYMSEDRNEFRGTGGHSTLQVDGVDQAIPEGPFAWGSLPTVQVDRWIEGKTFTFFAGNHTGYSRLPDPVLHRRFIFHLHDGFWLVRDRVEGRETHQLEISWHFAADLKIVRVGQAFVAQEHGLRLALLPVNTSDWKSELTSGFVSPAYGKKEPAPIVVSSTQVRIPIEHSTLIVPLLHAFDEPGTLLTLTTPADAGVHAYRYDGLGKSYLLIFAENNHSWSFGPWTSDAGFLCCEIVDNCVTRFILCDGGKVALNGNSVFANRQKIERLEWAQSKGASKVFCSEDAAIKHFSEEALISSASVF
ncbi:MAG TPA: alginate lyase family protein [Terriglobales bacterium]|nr:alginate lyase family protein [Terriglobales bacterium]